MNIEEHRKAFESHILINMDETWIARRVIEGVERYSNYECEMEWESFLAGMKYAEHLRKPIATVKARKDHHKWAVYFPTSLTAEAFDFETKEDAVYWAESKGYRVNE